MDEKLLHLLETKNFSQLTANEKQFVLQIITEQEYNEQHNILLISSEIIDEDIMTIPIDKQLLYKVLKQNKITSIINYKVSLIKIAAVFLVAMVSYHIVMAHIYNSNQQEPLVVHNTDTIYKIEKVYNTDTVYLTKYKTKIVKKDCDKLIPKIAQSTFDTQISKEKFEYYKKKIAYDLQNNKTHRKGKSLSNQTNIFRDTLFPVEDNVFVGLE